MLVGRGEPEATPRLNGYDVERARSVSSKIEGTWVYHHPASDETFELYPPLPSTGWAMYRKVFRSGKDGTWPGELKKEVPPVRRGV